MSPDRHARSDAADPGPPGAGSDDLRREGPGHRVPADRAAAAARGRTERAGRAARRRRLRRVERVRRAVPDADRRAAGGGRAAVQPVPHHRAVRADPAGAADRPQPPLGRAWAASPRPRPRRPGNSSLRPNTKAPLAMTLKLNGYSTAQFGKCHEVPVWQSSPMGPFDAWPSGGGGFETFYGFIGGENNQWDPALYDGTTPVEPPATAEEGYHLTEDLADHAVELGASAEGADAGQAVLRLLRPGRHARPAPRPEGVGRPVRGRVRRRLGRPARAHVRPAEGAGGHPGGRRADRAARRDPGLGRHARRAQAGAGPADGGLRRVPRAHRPPRRPADRRHRRPRGPRRHDRLLHHRRQRRLRRGHHERRLQRDGQLQRDGRARDPRVHAQQDGRASARRTPTTTTRSAGRGR